MAASVSTKPATVEAQLVLATLLDAAANADERADILSIDCAGVFDRHNDSTGGVRIAPHFVTVESDKPMMEFVRTVVHEANVADDDPPRAVDVDAPEGVDSKWGKPEAVECRMHPVFLRDEENAFAGFNDTGGHSSYVEVLDDTGRLL